MTVCLLTVLIFNFFLQAQTIQPNVTHSVLGEIDLKDYPIKSHALFQREITTTKALATQSTNSTNFNQNWQKTLFVKLNSSLFKYRDRNFSREDNSHIVKIL